MTLEMKINESGSWRNATAEELGNSLRERIGLLAEKAVVIRFKDENGLCILATGKWVQHYRDAGFVTIDLSKLAKLLDIDPVSIDALKIMGGEYVNVKLN